MPQTRERTTAPPGTRDAQRTPPSAGDRVRALEAERQSLVALLSILRSGAPATRLDLERESRLGRAVVTDRLATLAALNLIDEGGVGRSIGGRAPRLFRLRADAGRILVANIDGDTIGVGLCDLTGTLLFEHHEDIDLSATVDTLYERLEALFDWSLGQSGAPLWALSLGVPGTVELADGQGLGIPRLGLGPAFDGARLLERLAHRFEAPIFVRSAVQMATMGEAGALAPDRRRDMLLVDLGSEISAGVVVEGQLLRGARGIAGQIGHVHVGEGHETVCGCGNIGCLRTVAGREAVAREGRLAAEDGRSRLLAETLAETGDVTVADIGTAARLGDPFSADLLGRCGRIVGTVVAALVNLLNPATIVISGELAQTGDICLAAIREGIYRHCQPLVSRDVAILRSRMGRSAGLTGAANVAIAKIFAPDFMEDWITGGSPLAHPDVAAFLCGIETILGETS